jgi:hypothetical protein
LCYHSVPPSFLPLLHVKTVLLFRFFHFFITFIYLYHCMLSPTLPPHPLCYHSVPPSFLPLLHVKIVHSHLGLPFLYYVHTSISFHVFSHVAFS